MASIGQMLKRGSRQRLARQKLKSAAKGTMGSGVYRAGGVSTVTNQRISTLPYRESNVTSLVPVGETGLTDSGRRATAKAKLANNQMGSDGVHIGGAGGGLPAVVQQPSGGSGPRPGSGSTQGGSGDSKTFGDFFKRAGKGIVDETLSPEGLDRWAGNAMTGAAWFAGVGGVREMADGGSFWEGAGSGAVSGALWGTAATAMGSAARGFNPEASGFQGTRQELSKQLSAVMRNRRDVASAATNVVNNRG